MAEEFLVQGKLTKVEAPQTARNGKQWLPIAISRTKYGVWEFEEFSKFQENEGATVEIRYTESGQGDNKNYVKDSFKLLSPPPAKPTTAAITPHQIAQDTTEKDMFDRRLTIALEYTHARLRLELPEDPIAEATKWDNWVHRKTVARPPAKASAPPQPRAEGATAPEVETGPIKDVNDLLKRAKTELGLTSKVIPQLAENWQDGKPIQEMSPEEINEFWDSLKQTHPRKDQGG